MKARICVAALVAAAASTLGVGSGIDDLECVPEFGGANLSSLRINEIRVRDDKEPNEYFEIVGDPGTSLAGVWYVVLGDSEPSGTNSGVVEVAIDLSALTIPVDDGHLLVVDSESELGGEIEGELDIQLATDLNFEEDDNLTHLLVQSFTGLVGDDLDAPDDGVLDTEPWSAVLHAVVFMKQYEGPTGADEYTYPLPGTNGRPLVVGVDYIAETSASHCYVAHRAIPGAGPVVVLGENWGISIGPTNVSPLVDTPGTPNVIARYEWCRSDVDMDGATTMDDYWLVVMAEGEPSCGRREDVNADGIIDQDDQSHVLNDIGVCLPGDYDGDGDVDCDDWEILIGFGSGGLGGCEVGCTGDWDGGGRSGDGEDETGDGPCPW